MWIHLALILGVLPLQRSTYSLLDKKNPVVMISLLPAPRALEEKIEASGQQITPDTALPRQSPQPTELGDSPTSPEKKISTSSATPKPEKGTSTSEPPEPTGNTLTSAIRQPETSLPVPKPRRHAQSPVKKPNIHLKPQPIRPPRESIFPGFGSNYNTESVSALHPASNLDTEKELREKIRIQLIQGISQYFTYPPKARLWRWQGRVELNLEIGSDGSIQSISIHKSSGYPLLDQSAISTIRKIGTIVQSVEMGNNHQSIPILLPIEFRLQ